MTRARDAALLAGFALSLLVVLATPTCTRDRVADPARWVSMLTAAVASGSVALPAGTVVLVHPPWRDDVVSALDAARVLPPGVRVTSTIAPRHGEALPPLVVVREAGGVALPANLRHATRSTAQGGLELWSLAPRTGADARARDLVDALGRASVEVRLPDRTVACAWDAGADRHLCPDLPEWMYVGTQELVVDGKSERCVWAHPITGGTVAITFPSDEVRAPLDLALALSDAAADNRTGAEVTARLVADDTELARVSRKGARGFASARAASLPAGARTVRVEITTPHDGQRHTCFRLTSGGVP